MAPRVLARTMTILRTAAGNNPDFDTKTDMMQGRIDLPCFGPMKTANASCDRSVTSCREHKAVQVVPINAKRAGLLCYVSCYEPTRGFPVSPLDEIAPEQAGFCPVECESLRFDK